MLFNDGLIDKISNQNLIYFSKEKSDQHETNKIPNCKYIVNKDKNMVSKVRYPVKLPNNNKVKSPERVKELKIEENQLRNNDKTPLKFRAVQLSDNEILFNQFSINKRKISKNNIYTKEAIQKNSLLINKHKNYRNKSEILIIKKKPNIGYVRSILCPDIPNPNRNSSKEFIKSSPNFYETKNFEFDIDDELISKYKKNYKLVLDKNKNSLTKSEKISKSRNKVVHSEFIKSIETKTNKEHSFDSHDLTKSTNVMFSLSSNSFFSRKEKQMQTIEKELYYEKLKTYEPNPNLLDRNSNRKLTNMLLDNNFKRDNDKYIRKKTKLSTLIKNISPQISKGLNLNEVDISGDFERTEKEQKNILKMTERENVVPIKDFEDLYKIHLINTFVEKFNDRELVSDLPKHRKIFVILDGSIILSNKQIPGKLVDIPGKRFFINLKTKKERLVEFIKFIELCTRLFSTPVPFKSIFLKNGLPITDLFDVPENDKFVFISVSYIMKGISLIYNKKRSRNSILNKFMKMKNITSELTKTETRVFHRNSSTKNNFGSLLQREGKSNEMNFLKKIKMRNKKITINKLNYENQFLKFQRRTTQLKEEKWEKLFINKSFEQINSNNDEWAYYSDNEFNKTLQQKFIEQKFPNKYHLIIYLTQECIKFKPLIMRMKFPNNKNNKDMNDLIEKFIHHTKKKEKELQTYISKKKKRFKENNFQVKHEQEEQNKNSIIHQTKIMMKKLLENLELFKKEENSENLEEILVKYKTDYQLKYINKNKKQYKNIYFNLDRDVNKIYPSLITFNIPKLLKLYPNFNRAELYEMFVQFKILIKICIAVNRNLKLAKSGVDFSTFWSGVPQLSSEKVDLAHKIFRVINERKSSYLSLDEFLKGMSIIKSPEISDKIDMFFKIIDTDGNGLLSYDEVYDISLMSLQRNVADNNPHNQKLITDLAEYFATLIFNLVEIEKDGEIPLAKIREKIIEGGEEAEYLEMFCCADGFKKTDIYSFFNGKHK